MEEIYTGSWKLKFTNVGGRLQTYKCEDVSFEESKESSIRHKEPFFTENEQKFKVLLAAIPANDLKQQEPSAGNEEVLKLPEFLKVPKVKAETGEYNGIRSGGRSALYIEEGKFYRLKGCGNYVDQEKFRYPFPGFPLRSLEICGEYVAEELRGCSFPYLSLRELHYCNELKNILETRENNNENHHFEHIQVGNKPIGIWHYDFSNDNREGVFNTFTGIDICCGVFETLGEKRLSSHFMFGAEVMITKLGIVKWHGSASEIRDLLSNRESSSGGSNAAIETYIACCTGEHPFVPLNVVENSKFGVTTAEFGKIQKAMEESFSGDVKAVWDESAERVSAFLQSSSSLENVNIFALLYWRIGREVGEFLRILKENDIMWGYFFDHNPFEPHCNSHLNNFIMKIPTKDMPEGKLRRFTCGLDFDMTFDRKSFFSPYTNEYDEELFDTWKSSEVTEMERCIGGDIANNGLDIPQVHVTINDFTNEEIDQDSAKCISFALRDTMLAGFRSGFNMESDRYFHLYSPEIDDVFQSLINLALILAHFRQS